MRGNGRHSRFSDQRGGQLERVSELLTALAVVALFVVGLGCSSSDPRDGLYMGASGNSSVMIVVSKGNVTRIQMPYSAATSGSFSTGMVDETGSWSISNEAFSASLSAGAQTLIVKGTFANNSSVSGTWSTGASSGTWSAKKSESSGSGSGTRAPIAISPSGPTETGGAGGSPATVPNPVGAGDGGSVTVASDGPIRRPDSSVSSEIPRDSGVLDVALDVAWTAPGRDGSASDALGPDAGTRPLGVFVTSTGSGAAGGNLGGLEGADAKCQTLAAAVGAGNRTWRAYLTVVAPAVPVRASDRIGKGPWYDSLGNVVTLTGSGIAAMLSAKSDVVDENGQPVPTQEKAILAGTAGGTSSMNTCDNWTSNASSVRGTTMQPTLGSRTGIPVPCTAEGLATGQGSGRILCFAVD